MEWASEVKAYINCYSHLEPLQEPPRPPGLHHYTYINRKLPYDLLSNFVELNTSITPYRKIIYTQALNYVSLIK